MTDLRTQMIERIDEVIPTCVFHGSWAPQMAERIADAVLPLLSASPSPQGDEVERVARAIKDVVVPTTGDPLGVTLYESEAVVGSNADEAKESLMEICRIAARAAIAAMRPTLSEEDRARVEGVRSELEGLGKILKGMGYDFGTLAETFERATFLLSLIDKLTEAG